MPRSTRRPTRRGISLVEVLVALTVFAVGLLAQASAVAWLTRTVDRSRARDRGAALAVSQLEELRRASRTATAPCLSPSISGVLREPPLRLDWRATWGGDRLEGLVHIHRQGRGLPAVDTFTTSAPC